VGNSVNGADIDEWLVEAKRNEWHSKQNTWEIEPWLELLPLSSRQAAVLDALTKGKAFYGTCVYRKPYSS
jgi:hypothetical protein